MRLTCSYKVAALGGIILAAMLACSRSDVGTKSFLACLGVAGCAYLLTIREFFQTRHFSRHFIFACLLLSALWRIPFLLTPPGPDDDIRRYVWDGRVQHFGYNPYEVIPADAAFSNLHTAETRGLNHPDVPSPYPAGAQLFFRLVTGIHESTFAFKIAFVLCDLGIVLVLINLLRAAGQAEHWILAYAWHPLLATNVAGSGHIDIVGVLLLLISAAALARRWQTIAASAFALSVAVKFLPIVLVPFYWRRIRVRDALIGIAIFVLLYVPFLKGLKIPAGSLGTYVRSFRFNDPVFGILERVADPTVVAGLALVVGWATAIWLRKRTLQPTADDWAWPMAASLAFAPVVYPWYLLWLLPFLRAESTVPLMVWTISILPTYIVWHLRSLGQVWQLPPWVLLVVYGSVAVTSAIVWFRDKADRIQQPEARGVYKNSPE